MYFVLYYVLNSILRSLLLDWKNPSYLGCKAAFVFVFTLLNSEMKNEGEGVTAISVEISVELHLLFNARIMPGKAIYATHHTLSEEVN